MKGSTTCSVARMRGWLSLARSLAFTQGPVKGSEGLCRIRWDYIGMYRDRCGVGF